MRHDGINIDCCNINEDAYKLGYCQLTWVSVMFHVSYALAILWRLTGLATFVATKTIGCCRTTGVARWLSQLSVAYVAVVYTAYACLCGTFMSDRLSAYRNRSSPSGGDYDVVIGGKLQILLIRDMDTVLLFFASTTVYWCRVAYRREHSNVYEEHASCVRRLFGNTDDTGVCCPRPSPPSFVRAMDACCWSLYAALAVTLTMDVYRYSGTAPVKHAIVYIWSHYALFTGNMQFAVTVFGLRQCYRELNVRIRAGRGRMAFRVPFDLGSGVTTVNGSIPSVAKMSTLPSDVLFCNVALVNVLDKVNLLKMLKYWIDMHWSITQIVSRVNDLFKFRLFIFFLCGLLHLMLTPYLLSLTILNEDIDILPHIIERTLWFIVHIFRVVLMVHPCALLEEEAAKTQILLGSYLNTKIDFFDIKKIETYVQQLNTNKPEFSIYGMFVIDRQLVITLTGTVATYLVIILQLQGQS